MMVFARSFAAIALICSMWSLPVAAAQDNRSIEIGAIIKQGRDLIERGRDAEARTLMTPLIADPTTPTEWMALAFFFRGVANDRLKEPEAALADLGNALWFSSLPDAMRAQAHVRRASSLMQLNRVAEARQEAETAQILAPADPAIAQAMEAIARAPDADGAAVPQTSRIVKNEDRIAVERSVQPADAPADHEPTAALPGAAARDGKFAIQLGAIGNRASAEKEWQRIASAHGDLLQGLAARYLEKGNLIKLQAGPLQSYQASIALCGQLQKRGQDCFAITP